MQSEWEHLTGGGGLDDAFEKLVDLLDYPMFVVTAHAEGVAAGCLVGFASQTSIHPPRFPGRFVHEEPHVPSGGGRHPPGSTRV